MLVPSAHTPGSAGRLLPGPPVWAPVATSNVAPWHGQRADDPLSWMVQHACVHDAENAAYCPGPVATT